jgi:hypothetical protein
MLQLPHAFFFARGEKVTSKGSDGIRLLPWVVEGVVADELRLAA